tara:strand:- start:474 stop:1397 length:924 start_codon:yes stop_codon:yes gene_type:complete
MIELKNDSLRKHMVLPLKERLKIKFPTQRAILSPWLLESSLNMIYAWRGVGKTHVALEIAYAVASGGVFLNWKAESSEGVLYIDGEMPPSLLNTRLERMVNNESTYPDKLWIFGLSHEQIMPDLGTVEGQNVIDSYMLPEIKLIIIDNLSCLVRSGGRENDAESWNSIEQWALQKRAQGISIIFIHHSGKNGSQCGTSKRERVLDTVLLLKHPHDYEASQGARFEIHFEKARHLYGNSVKTLTVNLERKDDTYQWKTETLIESNKQKVIEMNKEGLSNKEIVAELGISRQAVHKHLKQSKESIASTG